MNIDYQREVLKRGMPWFVNSVKGLYYIQLRDNSYGLYQHYYQSDTDFFKEAYYLLLEKGLIKNRKIVETNRFPIDKADQCDALMKELGMFDGIREAYNLAKDDDSPEGILLHSILMWMSNNMDTCAQYNRLDFAKDCKRSIDKYKERLNNITDGLENKLNELNKIKELKDKIAKIEKEIYKQHYPYGGYIAGDGACWIKSD